jgi:hypothetical protein
MERSPEVASPNRKETIKLQPDYKFAVRVGDAVIRKLTFNDMTSNINIAWAPNSKSFVIAYSTAGASGPFRVRLFRFTPAGLSESGLPSKVLKDFKKYHSCSARRPSLFFGGWSTDGRNLLLVPEVAPSDDCGAEASKAIGYVVALNTDSISRKLAEAELTSVEDQCKAEGIISNWL